MQVVEAAQHLPQNVLDHALTVLIVVLLEDVEQGAVHDLQENPDAVLVVERVVDLQNSVVSATFVHQTDLIDNHVAVFLVWRGAKLHGAWLVIFEAADFEDFGEATLTQLLVVLDLVYLGRVRSFKLSLRRKILVKEAAHLSMRDDVFSTQVVHINCAFIT